MTQKLGLMICPICGRDPKGRPIKNTELLMKFLSLSERANWKLCRKHQDLYDEGFVALVEALPPKIQPGSLLPPDEAMRTGKIVHVRRVVADQLFGEAIDPKLSMVFCEPNVLERINQELQLAAKQASSVKENGIV